ncbi:hypothetical protein BCR44DRAFT_35448 [Catenaria anguillulae PL171]|uniref:Threonine/serine exporter-like N-terminal domain-containing protein n=1 Tax=Catenaria anguillulae PL171 TaxID=765915 RepID=A0A1Y2HMI1_9FUNG|nr:hypothetical protein BCR44DRAFT_35448 [Catenaria anguillulae PL171]
MLMLLMLNPASLWDLILTFILGTLNGILSHVGEVKKINALEVLVPMAIAMVGKICEVFLKDQICFGTITMFACFSYFPGTLMALSMVELASRNLVSGTVRMFYSFVRSVKFGFGLAMGARLIGWLNSHGIPGVEMPKDNIHCMDSTLRPYTADVYKNLGYELLVFIPMALCINVILRAKRTQWLGMAAASVVGLLTLQAASGIFTKDASAALAAFTIGMVAHVQARYKDDLAIANILAGICWLTPGSVGVRGAALLMTDDLKGSTSFALDMIIRAMSVSIGLYVSGLVLFPMVRKSKISVLSL